MLCTDAAPAATWPVGVLRLLHVGFFKNSSRVVCLLGETLDKNHRPETPYEAQR